MLRLSSTIDQVTVYRQGALVTRVVECSQPDSGWPEKIALTGLPLALQDQTLRVSLEFPQGGSGVLANDLGVELEWEEGSKADAPVAERQDTGPLRDQIAELAQRIEVLTHNLARVETLQPGARVVYEDQAPAAYPLKARRAVVKLRQELLAKWNEQRRQLMEEQYELQLRMAEMERPAPVVPPGPDALSKVVLVNLRCTSDSCAPALRILLSYQMEGARWAPSYTLRFDRDFTLAEVDMRALVCQSSGEHWTDVRLAVSTADMTQWKELPELTSRRLGRTQQAPKKIGWRPPPVNTDQLFADYDKGPSALVSLPVESVADAFPVQIQADPFAAPAHDPFAAPAPELDLFSVGGRGGEGMDPFASADPFAAQADPFACAPSDPFGSPASDPFAAPSASDPFGGPPAADPFGESPPARAGLMRRSSAEGGGGLQERIAKLNAKPSLSARPAMSSPRPSPPVRPGSPAPQAQAAPSGWMPEWAGEVSWELPAPDLMTYGLLYLPGVGERGRGKLQPQSPLGAGLRALKLRYPDSDVPSRAGRMLETALSECRRALQQYVPAGHSVPSGAVQQDYLFVGEHRVELASDCQFHSLPLLRRPLPTHMHYQVVPKITCDVFRQAMIESLPDLALPAGPVDVFVGHDFLATTQLADVTPGETFQIGLGVEQSIKVVRNTHFAETTSGMMGGTLQLQHEVKIEAANQLAREVKLEIREALPGVPDGGEIKIKVDSCEPAWESLIHEPGHRWWLRIPAGESRTAKLNYSVEMSSKLELVGGNRREN